MYISSNKIEIFPSSIARPDFPYARILTEDHILDMIRSVAPSDKYVLTETYTDSTPLEFVIHGYYVKVDASASSKHNFGGKNVYAHIFIDTLSPTHPQLFGKDTGTSFEGVTFSDTETVTAPEALGNDYELYTLHLLTRNSTTDTFRIPMTSRKCLDGGEFE